MDLSSFLLQASPECQPIYEEIPPWQSDQSSDYVDTTSGYHTLPIESEYSESERGLFLVPVTDHKTPVVVSTDLRVPSGRTNKKFFTFHRTKHNNSEPVEKQGEIIKPDFMDQFSPFDQSNCVKTVVDSKTIDTHNNPRLVYKSYQSNTCRQSRLVDNKVQRHNQDNFLPRTAWTDVSGSDDWQNIVNENFPSVKDSKTIYDADLYERPPCPSPPDLISNKCSRGTKSPSIVSTSDVTVSPSSSELYPECRF